MKVRSTVTGSGKWKRKLHVVGWTRSKQTTCIMVGLGSSEAVVKVTRGGALPIWLTRSQVRKLRDVLDRLLGDRPTVTHETLRRLGLRVENCTPYSKPKKRSHR